MDRDALPVGTQLAEYRIERVLGEGGFGIVYQAVDTILQRRVAIKEFLPFALAGRASGLEIGLRSREHGEAFARGLHSFLDEARLLAQFDHPSLVRVYRFWEQNNTAYMAMPYYEGRTLQAVRREMIR
ncbi:MAG TPA: protein kinase, partial [Burkholderiaceae bacterium]|nr:protein kinase [Burkholderiaceae bacterium]